MTEPSTDLALPHDQPPSVQLAEPPPPTVEVSGLVRWAFEARQAHAIAESLSRTSFVPSTMRGKPGEITAAILTGAEIGLEPMASLRSMDIIQGTPALRAHAMRAVLQSKGHEIELVESTAERCVMRGRRYYGIGRDMGNWQTVIWTTERAGKMGLLGKDTWQKQGQAMLVARATGELSRLIASDALHALAYAAEELADSEPAAPPRVAMAELAGTPTAAEPEPKPEPVAAAEPAPLVDDTYPAAGRVPEATPEITSEPEAPPAAPSEPVAAPEHVPHADSQPSKPEGPKAISQRQMGALFAAGSALGLDYAKERDEFLAEVAAEVVPSEGRVIASVKDLTSAEASLLIELWSKRASEAPAEQS